MNENQLYALRRAFVLASKAFAVISYAGALFGILAGIVGAIYTFLDSNVGIECLVFAAWSVSSAVLGVVANLVAMSAVELSDRMLDIVTFRDYKKSLYELDKARFLMKRWFVAMVVSGVGMFITPWVIPAFAVSASICLANAAVEHTVMRLYEDTGCDEIMVERAFG